MARMNLVKLFRTALFHITANFIGTVTLLKKSPTQVFSGEFCKIFGDCFFENICEQIIYIRYRVITFFRFF